MTPDPRAATGGSGRPFTASQWPAAHPAISRPRAALPCSMSLALILAEPVLRTHPECHVLTLAVRVAGDVTVTARRAEVAAGHREPLYGMEFLLADHRPLDADIAVRRAIVLDAEAEPAGRADRPGLARPAASQHGQQATRLIAVPDRDGERPARLAHCRAQYADMHAGKELLALGSAHENPHDRFIPDRRRASWPGSPLPQEPRTARSGRHDLEASQGRGPRHSRSAIAAEATLPPITPGYKPMVRSTHLIRLIETSGRRAGLAGMAVSQVVALRGPGWLALEPPAAPDGSGFRTT